MYPAFDTETVNGPSSREQDDTFLGLEALSARVGIQSSVSAIRFVKKMRGGTQAHLLETSDGYAYVTKFVNNPQHRRVLVNEWICAEILKYLQISTPECAAVEVSQQFLAANPTVSIELAHGKLPITPGLHFGSQFPGVPDKTPVYDILPRKFFSDVSNRDHFIGLLAVDKWLGNTDSRQVVFTRKALPDPSRLGEPRGAFHAFAIDHGFVFGGSSWRFGDSPLHGIYAEPQAYLDLQSMDDLEPWLQRIEDIPLQLFSGILRRIPKAWISQEDAACLEGLMERLVRRRSRLADLVLAGIRARRDRFPAWRDSYIVG